MFILPIIKDNPVRRVPWVILSLITINCLTLAWTYLANDPSEVFKTWGYTPAHPSVLTLFTSMFLHAGLLHLLGNMWFLWMFGNMIENCLGRLWFSISYLICGVGAALLHSMLDATPTIALVGASGAISGIAGMFFVLFPKQKFELTFYFIRWRVTSWNTLTHAAVGTWIGEQLLLALLMRVSHFSSIAFWAHIGGFIAGLLLGAMARATVSDRLIQNRLKLKPLYSPGPPQQEQESETEIIQLKL